MTLIELKQKYPGLIRQLRDEHYKEYLEKHGDELEQGADQIAGRAGVKKK